MDEVQCTTVGGKIYVQGASDNDCEYNIYCYDPLSDTWNTLLCAPPVKYCGLGNLDNVLVAVGGIKKDNTVTNEVYRYSGHQWKEGVIRNMEVARHSTCVLSFTSQLVVAGGKTKSDLEQYSRHVEIYDKENNKWIKTIPLPKACDLSSVVIQDKAFVIGRSKIGSKLVYFVSSEDLERGKESLDYDDTASIGDLPTWKALQETPMELPSAASLGGNLMTVGGRIDGCTTKNIHMYDLKKRKWRHIEGLFVPTPLFACGVCTPSRTEFYVIGGCCESSNDRSSFPRVNTMYRFTLSSM